MDDESIHEEITISGVKEEEIKSENVKFGDFIIKIRDLVEIKAEEILSIKSKQRRKLLANFGFFLNEFIFKIAEKYNFEFLFNNFFNILVEEEEEYYFKTLENIHKHKYTEWFSLYEETISEILNLKYKFNNRYFSIRFFINGLMDYNMIFIDSMRYINREELI